LVSHPHAMDVIARNVTITLRGAVLEDEAQKLVSEVGSIRHQPAIILYATAMLPTFPVCRAGAAGGTAVRLATRLAARAADVAGRSQGVYGLFSSQPSDQSCGAAMWLGALGASNLKWKRKGDGAIKTIGELIERSVLIPPARAGRGPCNSLEGRRRSRFRAGQRQQAGIAPVPALTIFDWPDGCEASDGCVSARGVQWAPPSVVFQTPPPSGALRWTTLALAGRRRWH
jgi:hypothetical protein